MSSSPKYLQILIFLLIFTFIPVNSLCVQGYDSCSTCLNSTHCTTCHPFFGLNSQGLCVRCTDLNCKSCSGDTPGSCGGCVDYYQLNVSSCVKNETCAQTDCIHCPNSTAVCEQCDYFTPFIGLYNETCTNCSVVNCKWCKQNATSCEYCNYGYGSIVINDTMYCSSCSDYHTNCSACWSDIRYCQVCVNHYGVDLATATGECVLCKNDNCQVCGEDYNVCTQCMTNYGLNQTGCYLCNRSQSFCSTCDPSVLIKCNSCPPQRYMDNYVCKCHPLNCYLCSNISTCDECAAGYYRKTDGQCQVCPQNCRYCFFSIMHSKPECTECVSDLFGLDDSLPPVCHQICGDNYNSEYPCENPISMLYDGCDHNCQVEDNFTCTLLNTTNLTDICKYSGVIQLQYNGYTKQQFSNGITLKFSIFPPLYAFTITPQQDLIQMFELSNQNFSVKSILINQQTCQMIFLCDLIGDVFSDQIIYVNFNPSQASTFDYFLTNATTLSSFQFSDTVYYYQQIVFTFSNLILYICYVISALGWVSSILGLVLRKLAGLQAMMVIQFSWLAILCLNAPLLLPFRQTYPLIYSNGYNHHFSEFDSQISRQSPYTSNFHLSRILLYDNWNINLLLILLAFLFVIASTIKVKRFTSSHSSEIKQNDELAEQLEKMMEQNGKTYEWLMFLCMLNLTYFVCVSILFFKLGNITNMLSLILFSVGTAIFLFTFTKFAIDPYPFGYFRFSFSLKCLATQHYCLVIIVTTSSVALLFFFSQHTFAALGPSFVFLIYTLIYRPYKFLKDNLRYAFNLLTICSFISLRVYVEFSPSQSLNVMPTYIFLLINVCFLLPCTVILGIVYTIYGHCQEKLMLEQDEAYRETQNGKKQWMRRNVLKQLVSIQNYNKKFGDVTLKTVFKDLIDPSTSLVEASNLLKKEKKNETTDRPLIVEEVEENTNIKYKQYKKLIKRDQIDLIKSIKEKKSEDLDNIVFKNFNYEHDKQKLTEHKNGQRGQKVTGEQKIQKADNSAIKVFKASEKKKLNIQLSEDILVSQNRFIKFKAIEENVKKQKQKNEVASINSLMREYENIQNIDIL